MFRNLYADTRKIFFSRGFSGGISAILVYQLLGSLLLWLLTVLLVEGQMAAEDIAKVLNEALSTVQQWLGIASA